MSNTALICRSFQNWTQSYGQPSSVSYTAEEMLEQFTAREIEMLSAGQVLVKGECRYVNAVALALLAGI